MENLCPFLSRFFCPWRSGGRLHSWWRLEVKSKDESHIPVRYSLGFFITSLGFYDTSLGFSYPSPGPEPWTLASDLKKPRLRAASAQVAPWWSLEVKCKGKPQVPVRYSLRNPL